MISLQGGVVNLCGYREILSYNYLPAEMWDAPMWELWYYV